MKFTITSVRANTVPTLFIRVKGQIANLNIEVRHIKTVTVKKNDRISSSSLNPGVLLSDIKLPSAIICPGRKIDITAILQKRINCIGIIGSTVTNYTMIRYINDRQIVKHTQFFIQFINF